MFGPRYPGLAAALEAMAMIELEPGDADDAAQHAERPLATCEGTFGSDHPSVATCPGILVGTHAQAGRFDQGQQLSKCVLSIVDRKPDATRPGSVAALGKLASLHQQIGDNERASSPYERPIQDAEQAFGLDHPNPVGLLERYAELLAPMDRNEEASQLKVQAHAVREICGRPAAQ